MATVTNIADLKVGQIIVVSDIGTWGARVMALDDKHHTVVIRDMRDGKLRPLSHPNDGGEVWSAKDGSESLIFIAETNPTIDLLRSIVAPSYSLRIVQIDVSIDLDCDAITWLIEHVSDGDSTTLVIPDHYHEGAYLC